MTGLPYCDFHARRAFQPPQPRRRDREVFVPGVIAAQLSPAAGCRSSRRQRRWSRRRRRPSETSCALPMRGRWQSSGGKAGGCGAAPGLFSAAHQARRAAGAGRQEAEDPASHYVGAWAGSHPAPTDRLRARSPAAGSPKVRCDDVPMLQAGRTFGMVPRDSGSAAGFSGRQRRTLACGRACLSPRWRSLQGETAMGAVMWAIIGCGLLSIVYGAYTVRAVMASDAGTPRMQEIAAAIQEGAQAYLTRQYTTIAIAGAVIFVIVGLLLGLAGRHRLPDRRGAVGHGGLHRHAGLGARQRAHGAGLHPLARRRPLDGLPRRRGHGHAGRGPRAAGRRRLLHHPHRRHWATRRPAARSSTPWWRSASAPR